MPKTEVFYRGVPVPDVYLPNLGTAEYRHFKRGIDAALEQSTTSKYYLADDDLFYRIVDGRSPELWSDRGKWVPTTTGARNAADLNTHWVGTLQEITADELPDAAR